MSLKTQKPSVPVYKPLFTLLFGVLAGVVLGAAAMRYWWATTLADAMRSASLVAELNSKAEQSLLMVIASCVMLVCVICLEIYCAKKSIKKSEPPLNPAAKIS
ncbi:hypothetical protein [Pseudomonas sp. NPDC096950]|uniref:hypothetical protein n=1 Tax=Pseudomonas sp. NPDC096950 TaxID=3364485 RepID=UPI00383B83D7